MLRFMLGTAFASDGKNNTSDAWQLRGGVFGVYQPNDAWTWLVGAIALGRNDLPVVPAVGVIFQPHLGLRYELTMPRPRIAYLVRDNGPRQQWAYIGAGLNGGTWGYERANGENQQLTYGDWRLLVGWESVPTPKPGMPFTLGRKFAAEAGYVFARKFEFEQHSADIDLDNTLMVRATMSF
jgi:hypothetical protein